MYTYITYIGCMLVNLHIARYVARFSRCVHKKALESSLLPTLANLATGGWGLQWGYPQNGCFIMDKFYLDDLGVSPFSDISSTKCYEDLHGSSGWYTYSQQLKMATAFWGELPKNPIRIPSTEIGKHSCAVRKMLCLDPKAFRVTASGSITAPLAS